MGSAIDKKLDLLQQVMLSIAIQHGWGYKYAKFSQKNNQSLLIHSLNAFSVARELGQPGFDLDDDELFIGCLGAFLHDYQKAQTRWQNAAIEFINGERRFEDGSFEHDDGSEEQRDILRGFLGAIEKEMVLTGISAGITALTNRILNLVVFTHDTENHAAAVRRRNQVGAVDALVPLVRLADSIASIKEPKDIVSRIRDLSLPQGKRMSFDFHELSSIRGLVTSFLNEALVNLMKELEWKPLLYFGNGVVYFRMTRPEMRSNLKVRLEKLLRDQEEQFKSSETYTIGMTNAVIGPLTQTKWPCLQIVREEDIPEIVRHLSAMPAMNKEDNYAEVVLSKATDKQKVLIREFVKKCGSSQEDSDNAILALMISDFDLFIYVADFLNGYRGYAIQSGRMAEYDERVNMLLAQNELDFKLDELSGLGNTTQIENRLSTIAKLWDLDGRKLHLTNNRREALVNEFISVLRGVLKEFSSSAPLLFTQSAKELLMTDILHLPVNILETEDFSRIAMTSHERYLDGKDQKNRICSFCGAEGVVDAPATLFGDGSQKFSNFIPGGARIGAGRKAQVCALCLVESTLRAFFFPSAPATTFVIIPDLSLSPALAAQWAEGVKSFVRTEMIGLSSVYAWNMTRVYTALVRDEAINNASELASMLRPTKASVDRLTKHLEAQWSDPSLLKYKVLTETPESTFQDIARAHLSGEIIINPRYLEDFRSPSRTQGTAYMTPSHMFIFFRNKLYLDEKESASTISIRAYFLALIVSKIFHARVIVTDGLAPISDFSMHGMVRTQVPAPAAIALSGLGITEETPLHELQSALRKLAALTLVSMGYVEGLGKDRLLRLAGMNRGAILRRAEHEDWRKISQWQKKRLIDLLEALPEVFASASENKTTTG